MPVLTLIITDVGRAEIVNADNTGTLPVVINQIALGSGQWSPDETVTALQAEIKRVNTIGGVAINPDTIHITITDDSTDVYSLGEFGLYTDTGVLFAIYSDAVDGITDKVADAALLIAADTVFTSIAPGSITVGGTGFLNPAASETQAGVLKLATQLLVDLGLDDTTAVTPEKLASILSMYLLSAGYNAADVLAKLLTVDGAASGLDADLLDAQHGGFYQNAGNLNAGTLPGARFLDSSHGNRGGGSLHALADAVNAGFMSPFDFNKLSGVEAAATADQTAAEIKTAYESNASTNALTDALLAKLNGIETAATADQTAAEIKAAYESNANTNALTDALLALINGHSESLASNGYVKLPNGLKIVWGSVTPVGNSSVTISWPSAFNTACLQAIVSHGWGFTSVLNNDAAIYGLSATNGTIRNSTPSGSPTLRYLAVGY